MACQKTEPLPYKLSLKTCKDQVARQNSRHRSPEKGRDAESTYSSEKKKAKRKVQGVPQSQTAALPDTKWKRKPTNPDKHKSNKCTKSTKISSLFPHRGNRNAKRTEKHKNKMTQSKTQNKSPRRINHKAKKSKTNTGTTALERSVE